MEGGTVLEHLQAAQAQTGIVPEVLADAPALPEGCDNAWHAFAELHACRGEGMGPERITYGDIDAFQRVTGTRLEPWEVAAIHAADQAYLRSDLAKGGQDD